MKLLVCGKGGCGKSAVTALIAKEFVRQGYQAVVADNDESNFGLHTYLGMERPAGLVEYFGGRDEVFEKVDEVEGALRLEDVSSEYVSRKDGINLLVMGKIEEYGEGCACPINALSSKFYDSLSLKDGEFLLVDAEAGIEHFGRGVEDGIDVILMVVDPTQESLRLAERVSDFGEEMGLDTFFVLNKVNDSVEGFLKRSFPDGEVLGEVPEMDEISEASLRGSELDLELRSIRKIAENLVKIAREV